MPQMFNPRVRRDNETAFGPNSRFAAISNYSNSSQKRMEMVQKLDKRNADFQLGIYAKHSDIHLSALKRLRKQLLQSLQRNKAYQKASESRCFTTIMAKDPKKALNTNYSYRAMRPDISQALWHMHPTYIREHNALMQKEQSKQTQELIIKRNLKRILSPRTRIRRENRILEMRLTKGDTAVRELEQGNEAWFMTPSPVKRPEIINTPEMSPVLETKSGFITKLEKNSKSSEERNAAAPPEETSADFPTKCKLPPIKPTDDAAEVTLESDPPKSKEINAPRCEKVLPPISSMKGKPGIVANKSNITHRGRLNLKPEQANSTSGRVTQAAFSRITPAVSQ